MNLEVELHGGLESGLERLRLHFVFLWEREFKLPWREAGPPNHLDDKVDSDLERLRLHFVFLSHDGHR